MFVPGRIYTDDEPQSAYAYNEIGDAFNFCRLRKIWIPTGIGDDAVFQRGQATVDMNSLATATVAVTFATSMPTSNPKILLTPINTTIYGATHESVSATGFTVRARVIGTPADRTLDVNIPVNWWAFDAPTTGGGTTYLEPRRWTAETVDDTKLDAEWKDKFDWSKRQLLEAANASDAHLLYRHGVTIFDGLGADFSEQITFDTPFGTVPNVQAQALATSVYATFALAVSPTGLTLAVRHIKESSVTVKNMKVFWLGVGGAGQTIGVWSGAPKNWAGTDIPTGATLTSEVGDRINYLKERKLEFGAETDEGKHAEFGEKVVTVLSGQTNGEGTVTFNTAFRSVTPTPKVTAGSVDSGAWLAFAQAISSTALTIKVRHYDDQPAGADKTITVDYLGVG